MTEEKIISVTLENDNVIKTVKEVYEPRYTGTCTYDQAECEAVVEDLKENCKIWTTKHSREGFDSLDTGEDWEPEGNSVVEDIASFQKYLDDTYGKDKYEAFALGAYVHSDVSFAFNKGEDTRCRWDSGTCGFIGIDKSVYNFEHLDKLVEDLSDAWNGYITMYEVYDNYDDVQVDCIWSTESYDTIDEWKAEMAKKYGVGQFDEHFD